MEKIIKSPIFYMGSKEKLINNGLIGLFPKNINTFYELFCGSGVVSMNVSASAYVLNDISKHVVGLIRYFQQHESSYIVNRLEQLIEHYGLPTFSTDTRKYKGDREVYKDRFKALRDDYNKSGDAELLYLLNIFSNSHMIRFNSSGEFNMPFGNGYFTEQTKSAIMSHNYKKIDIISNFDFRCYCSKDFLKNDFVYLDPPYLTSGATYNEGNGWTKKDENDFHDFCDLLDGKSVKFGISNIVENASLIGWANQKKYKVHIFDELHCACGNGNKKRREVYICNY